MTTPWGVTVVIAARNEARQIGECIAAVAWADEVIVADHGSADGTAEAASAAGARVVDVADAPSIGAARNHAIETATCQWILVVDADERATPELASAVRELIRELVPERAGPEESAQDRARIAMRSGAPQGWRVHRRNFFLGREVRHGGWEKDRPVRFFPRTLRYSTDRVHEHVELEGGTGMLDGALLHAPYTSMDAYFEKFDRYSRWWAEDRFARGKRSSVLAVVMKPPARFFSMYVLRLGFLDGARGAILAALAAGSVMAKYARLWAMRTE